MTTTTEPRLTAKQKRVLALLEQDVPISDIARRMRISVGGVHSHVRKIRQAGVTLPAERTADDGGSSAPAAASVNGAVSEDEVVSYVSQAVAETQAKITAIEMEVEATANTLATLQADREQLAARARRYDAMLHAAE